METVNKCRCCLTEGLHKDLNSPYISMNNTEMYGQMLSECFNIQLLSSPYISNGICDPCIKCLRAAVAFKHQVLQAEDGILKMINKDDADLENIINMDVKLEPDEYCIDGDDLDSDDYTLAQTIQLEAENQMKPEPAQSVSNKQSAVKITKQDGIKSKKIAQTPSITLNAIAVPVNVREKKQKKNISVTIGSNNLALKWKKTKNTDLDSQFEDRKPKLMLSKPQAKNDRSKLKSEAKSDRLKRKHNLQTILQDTNVTPFSKSLTLAGYTCVFCVKNFDGPEILRNHVSENHEKQRLDFGFAFSKDDYWAKVDIFDLTCTSCGAKFDSISNITDHLSEIHKKTFYIDVKDHIIPYKLDKINNMFQCAVCTSTNETFKMLTQHMNMHYGNFVCHVCGATFVTKRSKAVHDKIHEGANSKCETCGKVFQNKTRLQYHTKLRHQEERVAISHCNECGMGFHNYYQRNSHMIKVHNAEARYKCNVCNRSFLLKTLLMNHVKKNHLMEKNVACLECGKRFFCNRMLKGHMLKHTGEKNFVCAICNKAYGRRFTLREHMRIHNNDRRFKCDVCQMMFVQKCSLKSHLLSNHGISMQACEISVNIETKDGVEKFFRNHRLKDHMLKHTGEKNFVCTICNKAYGRRDTLRQHMRIHNNDRRFKCDVCQKMFVQKSGLKSHLLSNHGISMQTCDINVNIETKDGAEK